jgi:hypothetical protein
MNGGYDPHSLNAMLSRIIERLDRQDLSSEVYRAEIRQTLSEIKEQTVRTNGRVTFIERWIDSFKAKTAVVIFFGSGAVSLISWYVTNVVLKQ